MPRYLRFLLLAVGFTPYLTKLPYMFRAWRDSPLDRLDWIFVLLFSVLFPLVWTRTRKRKEVARADYTVLLVLIPALLGYLVLSVIGINALQILCSILFAYSVFWLIYGGQNAYRVLPAFGLLVLGVTSTTYWINYYVGDPGMMAGHLIKYAAALVLCLWLAVNFIWEKKVQTRTLLYAGAVVLTIFYVALSNSTTSKKGAPLLLPLAEGKNGGYLSQAQEVTVNDIRFFGEDSQIERYYYIGDGAGIHILGVTCGNKINSIHPASHCLRSSGWIILSEEIAKVNLAGEDVYLGEIIAQYQNAPCLFWVWYSNSEYSTGSFVHFRKDWSEDEIWHTYQIMVPLQGMELPELNTARKELLSLLKSLPPVDVTLD